VVQEEAWMNERARRACDEACAEFVDAFEDTQAKGKPLWLIWKYEGGDTLADLMAKKEFPANLEVGLFGRPLQVRSYPPLSLLLHLSLLRRSWVHTRRYGCRKLKFSAKDPLSQS
jgi:hypothetical protein